MELRSDALVVGTILKGEAYTYKIEKVLGQGSFGITYLAVTHMKLNSTIPGNLGKMTEEVDVEVKVAVKEFFMSDLNSRSDDGTIEGSNSKLAQNYRDRFRKEAKNLSLLDHPNIVEVLEVFDTNNTTYYTMKYVNGQNLDDYIKSKGGLEEREAIGIIKSIAKALQYMHARKMLHLDLKPKNIMLDKNGKPFLIDFGLSKQYDDKGNPENSTAIGLGTPGYAPIEQANSNQEGLFSPTLDIYALGGTLYKMLTGNTPPNSSIVNDKGLPELPSSITSHICSVVKHAMQPRKSERIQSVDEFLSLLDKKENMPQMSVVSGSDDTEYGDTSHSTVPSKTVLSGDYPVKSSPMSLWRIKYYLIGIVVIIVGCAMFFLLKSFISTSHEEQQALVTESLGEDATALEGESQMHPVLKELVDNMVHVDGGTFLMGASAVQSGDVDHDEKPVHEITLSPFSIGKYEVTQEEWEFVMGSNPSHKKGSRLPVEQVSWEDCQRFIQKLNELTQLNFRLPTEAEWEYAARGGQLSKSYLYVGSNKLQDVAWYGDNSDKQTHDVGKKLPNELGLFDMSGNVYEWCQDWYGETYYKSSPQNDPIGPSSGIYRMIRGGGYNSKVDFLRISYRDYNKPEYKEAFLGFRLAQ